MFFESEKRDDMTNGKKDEREYAYHVDRVCFDQNSVDRKKKVENVKQYIRGVYIQPLLFYVGVFGYLVDRTEE